jgi:hypothetical protein
MSDVDIWLGHRKEIVAASCRPAPRCWDRPVDQSLVWLANASVPKRGGDEAVAIRGFACGIDDLDLKPIDRHIIAAVAQRHVLQPALRWTKRGLPRLTDAPALGTAKMPEITDSVGQDPSLPTRVRRMACSAGSFPTRKQMGEAGCGFISKYRPRGKLRSPPCPPGQSWHDQRPTAPL